MSIQPPSPFRPDRKQECAKAISEAMSVLEHEALAVGWTQEELAAAFRQFTHGAELRALPKEKYASVAKQIVDRLIRE
ncbi:hypothetical protein FPY71_09910 [Aureimonas fodinaquatilis]|uniref:Uncharacterized protein n=1 Tax=Aureimonas fodinaquatilis TaxID=2565783 RepID=A0A5B0DYE1_9HYPH|nr:hypothetical protein [Aureimonas fodinaquatilis]KAA0970781.1 hypothetical protein FPY71_09910 [Aureimonas fodinaquatilis]